MPAFRSSAFTHPLLAKTISIPRFFLITNCRFCNGLQIVVLVWLMDVPEALKKNLDWYIAKQQELSAKYNGKVLLIVDQNLVEAFDSMEAAYGAAVKSYAPGTFTLQPCSPDSNSYTLTLYSPFYSATV